MSLHGADVASYQATLNIGDVKSQIKFVIIKATEGLSYVNPYCDMHYQQAKAANVMRGFYHFARNEQGHTAEQEAEYFYNNTKGYIHDGIAVLDWETNTADVAWAKRFLDRFYEQSKLRPAQGQR